MPVQQKNEMQKPKHPRKVRGEVLGTTAHQTPHCIHCH